MTITPDNPLTRLARAESRFLATQFLAPVVYGSGVTLGIADVRCTLRVVPADFRGWGIFRPISHACARAVRIATAGERRRYLDLFPAIRLIVVAREADVITAIAANESDRRFDISGPATVNLAFAGELFDTIVARYDGCQFWFDQIDSRANNGSAAYLRRELSYMTRPARIVRPGLTKAHRDAYAMRIGRQPVTKPGINLTVVSSGMRLGA